MSGDLFAAAASDAQGRAPLAERMRPQTLDAILGQGHVLGAGQLLHEMVQSKKLRSLILWGPPGCGKTTLARLLAHAVDMDLIAVSAVLSGVKDLRQAIAQAEQAWNQNRRRSVLFIDEIHRFNKAQQDALLPHVEAGTVVLIGATTENPSFEVISALLSRSRVVVLKPLDEEALGQLLEHALQTDTELDGVSISADARDALLRASDHDARRMLGTLEVAADLLPKGSHELTLPLIEQAGQKKWLRHDRKGDAHYDLVSAMIKSLRSSDPDAALYWCFRMIEAGEDPLFVLRRLVVFAAEDIGNADPRALQIALAARDSFQFVGLPEGRIPIAQACTYLATAPKSKASYRAMHAALEDVRALGSAPVPMNIRNAPTALMKELGHGAGYVDAHGDAQAARQQSLRPSEIANKSYYQPTGNGYERVIAERMQSLAPAANKKGG